VFLVSSPISATVNGSSLYGQRGYGELDKASQEGRY
jgi:hypothetical protein